MCMRTHATLTDQRQTRLPEFVWMPPGSRAHRPTRMANPMISHRLRAVAAGLPLVIFSALLMVSPSFGAESLRIVTPLAGSTVSGQLLVEGGIDVDVPVELTISLAPQTLGDCGSPLVENRLADTAGTFAIELATTSVPDGTYCLVAVADAGRLSTVIADIAVANALAPSDSLDGLQLPTLPVEGGEAAPVTSNPFGDPGVLGPAALGATAAIAVLVVVFGLWARQRSAG